MGSCNCIDSKIEPNFEILEVNQQSRKLSLSNEISSSPHSPNIFSKEILLTPLSQATSLPPEDILKSNSPSSPLIQVQSLFRRCLAQHSYRSTLVNPPPPLLPDSVLLLLTPHSKNAYISLPPFHFDSKFSYFVESSAKGRTSYARLSDGSIYDGELNDVGQPEGRGVMYYSDGGISEGGWRNGLLHGQGRRVSPQGDVFIGQWDSGKMHGQGRVRYTNRNYYEGGWNNDLQDGSGVEVWGDGSRFEGNYSYGLKNGEGRFMWPDGSYYCGEFVNDQIHGSGKYCWTNREYEGEWSQNKMQGRGVFKWKDGKMYEGEYLNDQKHGWGVFTWADGRKYEGFWAEGKQHGEGALMHRGVCKNGIWINGKLARSNEEMIKG